MCLRALLSESKLADSKRSCCGHWIGHKRRCLQLLAVLFRSWCCRYLLPSFFYFQILHWLCQRL